jgi:hypothetical protein
MTQALLGVGLIWFAVSFWVHKGNMDREISHELWRFRAGLTDDPPRSVFLLWAGSYMGAPSCRRSAR